MPHLLAGVVCSEENNKHKVLEGADVVAVADNDTLKIKTDAKGCFAFRFKNECRASIYVTCDGFSDFDAEYDITGSLTSAVISLHKAEMLDASCVKAEASLMKVVEDTVIYNAGVIERMQGDRAIDLLNQIPGIVVKDGQILIWGEAVEKTYVNGRLVYGDNPFAAALSLSADEVKSFRIYDRLNSLDSHRGLRHGKKDRVLDIVSFKDIFESLDMESQIRAGGGKSAEEAISGRHSAGFDIGYSTEWVQASLSVNENNVGDDTNGIDVVSGTAGALDSDVNHCSTGVSFVRKWKDMEWGNSFKAGYSFMREQESSSSRTVRDRISGVENDAFRYEESTDVTDSRRNHSINVDTDFKQTKIKDFGLGVAIDWNDKGTTSENAYLLSSNSTGELRQKQTSELEDRIREVSAYLNWSDPDCRNGWMPLINIGITHHGSNGSKLELDTLASSFSRRYLSGTTRGYGYEYSAGVSVSKVLADNMLSTSRIAVGVDGKIENRQCDKLYFNLLAGPDCIDEVNTHSFSWNDRQIDLFSTYEMEIMQTSFIIRSGVRIVNQEDIENIPVPVVTDKSYLMPANSIVQWMKSSSGSTFMVSYAFQPSIPSIEQTRQRVNNSNPLRLLMGNPNLKPMYNHSVSANILPRSFSDGSSIAVRMQASYLQNAIVDNVLYFSKASCFEAWGTVFNVDPGTTMTTYSNAAGDVSAFCDIAYSRRIALLKGIVSAGVTCNYNRIPQYDEGVLGNINSLRPLVNLSSSFSPVSGHLRFAISSSTGYIEEINSMGVILAELMTEKFSASAEARFLKIAFCKADYMGMLFKYYSGIGSDTAIQNLNATAGCRFFDGRLGVSISAIDILNREKRYSMRSTSSEFIQEWRPGYGRYVLVNIGYRFAKRNISKS